MAGSDHWARADSGPSEKGERWHPAAGLGSHAAEASANGQWPTEQKGREEELRTTGTWIRPDSKRNTGRKHPVARQTKEKTYYYTFLSFLSGLQNSK